MACCAQACPSRLVNCSTLLLFAIVLAAFSSPEHLARRLGDVGVLRARPFLTGRASLRSPPPPPSRVSADEGCVAFCDSASCARLAAGDGHEPDACIVRNIVLRDGVATLEFVASQGTLPARLAAQPGPLRFGGIAAAGPAALPAPCVVPGTTILVVNYQQHIPHFGEGLFFALSGLLAGDGELLCEAGRACRLLFHQVEQWPERRSIAWHEGALTVAAAAVPRHALTVLNADLFNVAGAARSAEVAVGCGAGALEFERLAVVHSRYMRRWFVSPLACAAFRGAALRLHAPTGSDVGVLQRGAVALLVRRGSRSITNSDAVEAALRKRFGVDVRTIAFDGLAFAEQVIALHDVRLLVAPHGAGLTNLVFLPPGAALVEVFPLHWRPGDYFDSLAGSCSVWYSAYQNEDVSSATLSESCRKSFGERLPPLDECADRQHCINCGKQSATLVDLTRLDELFRAAQVHLAAASAFENAAASAAALPLTAPRACGGTPCELLAAAAAALGPAFPRGELYAAEPPCRAPLVFRYDFGSGGYGDCLKGFVAVAQLAYVLGCPFAADFSRHPFGAALPFAAPGADTVAIPAAFAAANEGDALFVHMGDWSSGPHRLAARDAFFGAAMAPPAAALRKTGAVVVANIPHHRELAHALNVSEAGLVALSRFVFASFYSLVLDGAALGAFWPPLDAPHGGAAPPFRVGVHVRMGDKHIAAARGGPASADNRNPDEQELLAALRLVSLHASKIASGRPLLVFACADTTAARGLIRDALAPTPVFSASLEPVHIGYKDAFLRSGVDDARVVAREHLTLSTADAIFVASNSGFSKTACAIAGAAGVARPATPHCFLRVGSGWEPLEPGQGVWLE